LLTVVTDHHKSRGCKNGHALVFIAALCLAILTFPAFVAAGKNKDNAEEFRWEDAVADVASLPYPPRFIDSVKKAHSVTWPAVSQRTLMKKGTFCGETLVYDIGWGPFKAGFVVLTVEPDPEYHAIRIGAKALSNSFVDRFYRMRDFIISTVDETGLYPLFFEQHLREGKKFRSNGWILYDHERKKIHIKERRFKTLDATPFVNDYLSVLYNVRTRSFAPGDTFSLPLYAEGKVHSLYFVCKGRKNTTIESVEVPCLVLEPKLVTEKGAFNKKDKIEVWFTDDKLKRPVLIRSKIKVGSITARLINQSAVPEKKSEKKKTAVPPAPIEDSDGSTTTPPVPAAVDSGDTVESDTIVSPPDTSFPDVR
jgi:hypothetical protein